MEGLIGLVVLAVLAVPVLMLVALVMLLGLRTRVSGLERRVAELQAARDAGASAAAGASWAAAAHPAPVASAYSPAAATPPSPAPTPAPELMQAPRPDAIPPRVAAARVAAPDASATAPSTPDTRAMFDLGVDPPAPPPRAPQPPPLPPAPPPPARPSVFADAADRIRRWFTEGNVPVKVGVLVLFAGVAALMKYASDAGWLRVPIEARLSGVALASIAALAFGWRQRVPRRAFGLVVQGGAIGVLLLVVFAAFKFYGLIPAAFAFALSIVLVAAACVLAVRQDSLALAAFGLLAGFLAPLWLSTGQGNHVALFGYYAVLNAGVFAIAWWRAWRVLNVLGFVFTFGIGTLWGVLAYAPEHLGTTQPYLVLFFAMYLLVPLFNARAGRGGGTGGIDGTLVFGTPLVAFVLQAGLLEGERLPTAFVALSLGVLYALLAAFVRTRRWGAALQVPYAMLAVAFATLAVPLALTAQATACVFAVQGAALCWLGLQQARRLPELAGIALQLAAAFFFAVDAGLAPIPQVVFANSRFAAAALIAIAGFASAYVYRRARRDGIALAFYLWALAWWLGALLADIDAFLPHVRWPAVLVAFTATGALAAEAHARLGASRATAWTATAALALGVPMAWIVAEIDRSPLRDGAWIAWLLFAVLGARIVQVLRDAGRIGVLAHAAWWTTLALVAALALRHAAAQADLGSGWQWAAAALPWLALWWAIDRAPARMAWPQAQPESVRTLRRLVSTVLAAGAAIALFDDADSVPLPWLPLLNPLELVQLAVLAFGAHRLRRTGARGTAWTWLALAAFAFATVATVRAMHQLGGVPWSIDMLDDGGVQAALSIVWSVMGVVGWVVGSRRGLRTVWVAGAVLMGVVLVKLLAIDRQHLGGIAGIASFIAYGLLCAAVGYLAPAPPRRASTSAEPA